MATKRRVATPRGESLEPAQPGVPALSLREAVNIVYPFASKEWELRALERELATDWSIICLHVAGRLAFLASRAPRPPLRGR